MSRQYTERKEMNFAQIADEILAFWNSEKVFERSITIREGSPQFTFYEGPPSANVDFEAEAANSRGEPK